MTCQWCLIRSESLNKAEALVSSGLSPEHPNVERLLRRARGAELFAAREHGPVTLDERCPLDGAR